MISPLLLVVLVNSKSTPATILSGPQLDQMLIPGLYPIGMHNKGITEQSQNTVITFNATHTEN